MNQTENLTEFSGVAGRVLHRSVSGGSLISGLVFGFILFAGNGILIFGHAEKLTTPFTQVVMALALARFAVNGLFGEWSGTLFSDAGGSWATVGQVALRYLALSFAWMAPMLIIADVAFDEMAMNPAMMMMAPQMMRGLLFFAGFWMLAATLTPPLFLVVSVGADSFVEIFSPDHWKRMFSGRMDDLFAIYAVYSGGLIMTMVLCMPFVLFGFAANSKLGFVVCAFCCCLLLGVALNLLGRLCGFFACGDLGISAPAAPPRRDPAPAASTPPAPTPGPASVPVAPLGSVPVSGASPAGPAATAPPPLPECSIPPVAVGNRKPALMDAKQRVDAAMARFATDAPGAIAVLDDLEQTFASHPLVQQALAICLLRSGESERAVTVARSAVPFCMERGHTQLAAQIFKEFRAWIERLGLNREQLLALGGSLVSQEEWAAAAKAYSAVIGIDHAETRAIKGMLQVAEGILNQKRNPQAAAKIYRFLDKNCSDSPLAEYIRQGLAEAQQRLGAPVEPTPA